FDETVELHINTIEKGISGNFSLPHGTGKQIKIEILNQAENPKHVEEIVKKVETGKIDFDLLIATPDTMPRLARVARFLGPRGLMPNPKNGTITTKPDEIAKKFRGGQLNFKTEAKFPILHLIVGKVSFGEKKLTDNIRTVITAVQIKNIKNITLKSTMSPAIKVDNSTIS
ncbi:50S ribosomal protein L1, partial [Patescibacteria group bacterium]|nr:50S ribosomal protein L1 [Patescibacteria group bacterium]